MQMWALNPERNSPDQVVKPADKIAIGHKYQLRSTDNFRYLSVQFATSRGFFALYAVPCAIACLFVVTLPVIPLEVSEVLSDMMRPILRQPSPPLAHPPFLERV